MNFVMVLILVALSLSPLGLTTYVHADAPQPSVACLEPAPVPEPATGYGGNWEILNAVNVLGNISPGDTVSAYTGIPMQLSNGTWITLMGPPLGVYVVNPEDRDIKVLVYYKDLQRDVTLGDTVYAEPPAGADQWISLCHTQEMAGSSLGYTQGVVVPAGTKLLVTVVINIPGNATLDKPTYLALEFAEVSTGTIQYPMDAVFLIVPAPPSVNLMPFMVFIGTIIVGLVSICVFALSRLKRGPIR